MLRFDLSVVQEFSLKIGKKRNRIQFRADILNAMNLFDSEAGLGNNVVNDRMLIFRGVTADGGRVRTAVVAAVAVDDVDAAGRARVEHVAEPARVAAADARRHVLPFGARRQAIALAGAPRQPLRIRPRVVHRHADDRLVVRLREAGLAPVALAQQRERTHVAALARRAVRVARERGVLGFRHFVDRDRELVRDGAAADRLRHDDERGTARVAQRFAGAAHLPEPRRRGRDA